MEQKRHFLSNSDHPATPARPLTAGFRPGGKAKAAAILHSAGWLPCGPHLSCGEMYTERDVLQMVTETYAAAAPEN